MIYYNEDGYMDLLRDVREFGVDIPDRTGVGCQALFDSKVIFTPDKFPFSTYRSAPLRMAFEEFWFFMRGKTQTKELEEKGIFFWKGNTSREFLDSRGLIHLDEGDMGEAYGAQWRKFAGMNNCDQLVNTYNELKHNKYSRRLLTTFWNPADSEYMALTPCWHSHQFVVLPDAETGKDVLHLKLINRSLDACFGFLYAVQQYALYHRVMAKLLGFEVGLLSCDLTHVHIYENQKKYVDELLGRQRGVAGTVTITKELNTLDDVISMQWEDIKVEGLIVNEEKFVTPRPPMAV